MLRRSDNIQHRDILRGVNNKRELGAPVTMMLYRKPVRATPNSPQYTLLVDGIEAKLEGLYY